MLGPAAVEVLSRLAFFVASPALLFVTLAQADVRAVFSAPLVVTAVSSSIACLLYLPVGLLRRRPPGETAVGAMASGYVNAGNLGIPIATYALGNAAEVAPVMLFQLTVLAPVFSTVLDLMAARAHGEQPPLLRTLTAPARNPIDQEPVVILDDRRGERTGLADSDGRVEGLVVGQSLWCQHEFRRIPFRERQDTVVVAGHRSEAEGVPDQQPDQAVCDASPPLRPGRRP